jgi:hypothetical protein
MTGNELGYELGLEAVLAALLLGVCMAMGVGYLRRLGMLRRGNSLTSTVLFVIGMAGTLLIALVSEVITLEVAAVLVLSFAASGVPMIVESLLSDYLHQVEEVLK